MFVLVVAGGLDGRALKLRVLDGEASRRRVSPGCLRPFEDNDECKTMNSLEVECP